MPLITCNRTDLVLSSHFILSKAFLSCKPWKDLRLEVLQLYPRICMKCRSKTKRLNVDHIKPRKFYPELALELSNLQILCFECNIAKGNWDETDYRQDTILTQA